MASCKELEISLNDLKSIKPEELSNLKLDYLKFTRDNPEVILDLLNGNDSSISTIKETISDRKDILDKVGMLLSGLRPGMEFKVLNNGKNFESIEEALKTILTFSTILDSFDSEVDLLENNNLTEKDLKLYEANNENGPVTPTARIQAVIGRQYLNAMGYKEKSSDGVNMLDAYVKQGRGILQELEEKGIITLNPNGYWIGNNIVGIDGKRLEKGKSKVIKGETIQLTSKFIDDKGDIKRTVNDLHGYIKQLKRLVTPYTEYPPATEDYGYNAEAQDVEHSKAMKNIISAIGSSSFKLNGTVKNTLDALHKVYKDSKENEETFLKVIKEKYGFYPDVLEKALGIRNEYSGTALFTDSAIGRELSKVTPLIGLMQHYNELKDNDIYMAYFMAGNSRLFQDNDTLNYQTDNFMSRHILEASEPTVYDTKEDIDTLLKRVAVEYGVPVDVLLGDNKTNTNFEDILTEVTENNDGLDAIAYLAANLNNTGIDSKRVFEQYKILSVVKEIRDSYKSSKGKSVTTAFLAESDASASGLFIKILQNAYDENTQKVVNNLITPSKEDPERLEEAYQIALKVVSEDMIELKKAEEKAKEKEAKGITNKQLLSNKLQGVKYLKDLMGILDVGEDKLRAIVKMPIMTFAYSQTPANNKVSFAKDIAKSLMGMDTKGLSARNIDSLNKAIKHFDIDMSEFTRSNILAINQLTVEAQKHLYHELTKAISETTGEYLVNVLKENYTDTIFKNTEKDLEVLYKELSKFSANDKGVITEILDPFEYIRLKSLHKDKFDYSKVNRKYMRPLDKKKETLIKFNDKVSATMRLFMPNDISVKVLPIHMIDAASLMLATMRTLDMDYNTVTKLSKKNALALIHDAAMSNSKLLSKFEKEYEKALLEINTEYSVLEMVANEVQYKANKDGVTLSKTVQDIINSIPERSKARKEYLQSIETLEGSHTFETDLSDKAVNKATKDFNKSTKESVSTKQEETTVPKQKEEKSNANTTNPFEEPLTAVESTYTVNDLIDDIDVKGDKVDTTDTLGFDINKLNITASTKGLINKFFKDFKERLVVNKSVSELIETGKDTKVRDLLSGNVNIEDSYNGMFHRVFINLGNKVDIRDRTKELTNESKAEILAHEIEHFYTAIYLDNLKEDTHDVKYLKKAIKEYRKRHDKEILDAFNSLPENPVKEDMIKAFPADLKRTMYALYGPQLGTAFKIGASKKELLEVYTELSKSDVDMNSLNEFIAIVNTEAEYASKIFNIPTSVLGKIIKAVKEILKKAVGSRVLETDDISPINVLTAIEMVTRDGEKYIKSEEYVSARNSIDTIINDAVENDITVEELTNLIIGNNVSNKATVDFTTNNTQETPKIKYTPPKANDKSLDDKLTILLSKSNSVVADMIQSKVFPVGTTIGSIGFEAFDKWATNNIEFYPTVKQVVTDNWTHNKFIMEVKDYISPDDKTFTDFIAKMTPVYKEAKQNHIDRLDKDIVRLNEMLTSNYTKKEIEKLNDILTNSGLFRLINNGMLGKMLDGKDIKELISELESKLGKDSAVAKTMVKVYLDENLEGETNVKDNFYSYGFNPSKVNDLEALTSLYILNKTPDSVNILKDMKDNKTDLYNEIVTLTNGVYHANELLIAKTGEHHIGKGNLISDVNPTTYEFVVVTLEDLKKKEYSSDKDWKVLEHPKAGEKYGIIYREREQRIHDSNIGLTPSYIKTGIPIRSKLSNQDIPENRNSSVIDRDTHKVVYLTKEQREKLGYENNPIKSLMKTFAHKELLLETQALRDTIYDKFTYHYTTDKTKDMLLKVKNNEHPVFIQLDADLTESMLPKAIRDMYVIPDENLLSDIKGMRNKINLVRKDMAYRVVGTNEVVATSNHKASILLNRAKELVSYAKIPMLTLNPVKIGYDFITGITLAMSKGSGITRTFEYGKEATKYSEEISGLRNKLRLAKTIAIGKGINPEDDATVIRLEKQIERHPFSGALANGFIQSLGTELMVKDRETFSGLQKRIDDIVDKITKNDRGEATKFAKILMKVAKHKSINIDAIYLYLGDLLDNKKGTQGISNVLKDMGEQIRTIKTNEDATAYMSELIAAPNSSLVKLGGALTIYADLIPRWVIYRTNIDKGMAEEEAVKDALISLPNYNINMPSSIEFMSDLYLMSFPSFFMRTTIPIWNLLVKTPISFAGSLFVSDITNSNISILNTNILTKAEADMLITGPFDILNIDNILFRYGYLI